MTKQTDGKHWARGVDVRLWYWSDKAEQEADRERVVDYLVGEASKRRQKTPPAGFGPVGRYWGIWGAEWIRDVVEVRDLDSLAALQLRNRLDRWVGWKREVNRRRRYGGWTPRERPTEPAVSGAVGAPPGMSWRRPYDGITALGMTRAKGERLLGFAIKAAEYRAAVR